MSLARLRFCTPFDVLLSATLVELDRMNETSSLPYLVAGSPQSKLE